MNKLFQKVVRGVKQAWQSCKDGFQAVVQLARPVAGRAIVAVGVGGFFTALMSRVAQAQTDLTTTISALSTSWTAITVVIISVILIVIGRRLIRKI